MTIGKISIRPTSHYLYYHSDVEWEMVLAAILSPDIVLADKRYGKNRFTYIKKGKKVIIKVHTEREFINDIIWVINAFRMMR